LIKALIEEKGKEGREQGDSSGMPCDWFYWKLQVLISVGK
jgi:hypothetical protein